MKKFSLITSWVITMALLIAIVNWLSILLPETIPTLTKQYLFLALNLGGSIISILLALYARTEKEYRTLSDIVMSVNVVNVINLIASSIYILA